MTLNEYAIYLGIIRVFSVIAVIAPLVNIKEKIFKRLICALSLGLSYALLAIISTSLSLTSNLVWFVGLILSIFFTTLAIQKAASFKIWDSLYWAVVCSVLYQFSFTIVSSIDTRVGANITRTIIMSTPMYLALFILLGYGLIRQIKGSKDYEISWSHAIIAFFTMFPIDLFNHTLYIKNDFDAYNFMLILSAGLAYFCCLIVLVGQKVLLTRQFAVNELSIVEQLLQKEQIQSEISSSNIEYLNKTVHDLMHDLSKLYSLNDRDERSNYLDELSASLTLYNSFVDCGNKALNTILTENTIFCKNNNIDFKCFVDGSVLSFIDSADIYNIFGTLIEYVVSFVYKADSKEDKYIAIRSTTTGNLISVTLDAYCDQTKNLNKDDFIIKSASHALKRYGGTISQNNSDFIQLNLLIPMNQ